MRRLKGLAAVVVAFASLLAVGQENAWGQVRYTVTDLGTLGGPWSEAFGINASGQVVGWSDLPTSNEYWGDAFLYSNGTMTDLAWRGVGGGSQANGINASGQIVGQSSVSGDGFLYSNGTLSDVPPAAGCSNTQPLAINDSGQVVGWADTADGAQHAFLYSGGTTYDLDALSGISASSWATAINASGQIAGGFDTFGANSHAFLYSSGTLTDLGTLPGRLQSEAAAINASGQVAGYSYNNAGGDDHAFLYSGGQMIDLGVLDGATMSYAYGINASGEVVGYSPTTSGDSAFIYSNGTMANLNSLIDPNSGWKLGQAMAINDNGWITGWGSQAVGQHHAFLLIPVPEPSTIALLLASAACLLGYGWRRRTMRNKALMVVALASVLAMTVGVTQAQVSNVFNMPNGEASVQFVPVGDPGNPADPASGSLYGSVGYTYAMGKYDVTVGQYCQFLNAVAATDTYGLYNSYMAMTDLNYPTVGITQSGSPGSYTYAVSYTASAWNSYVAYNSSLYPSALAAANDAPVSAVTWGDAARFCNWLQNGQPSFLPGNPGEVAGSTETGGYTLNGATSESGLMAISRNAGATYFLPSENEWYKAAYYNPNAGTYWAYPTQSNSNPSNVLSATGTNNASFEVGTSPYYSDPTNYLTPVGAFAGSPGPFGTYDIGGDLYQWNEGTYLSDDRELRGGNWAFNITLLSLQVPEDPAVEDALAGFRVAMAPEPGCIALLVCGGIAVLVWWKSKLAVQPNQPQSMRILHQSRPATVCRSTETASMRASDSGKPLLIGSRAVMLRGAVRRSFREGIYMFLRYQVSRQLRLLLTSATLALAAFCRKKDLSALGRLLGVLAVSAALGASPASAAITTTGDVEPANPATWTSSTYAYVGNTANGTMTVNGGSAIQSYNAWIGDDSTGVATVDGAGSTWTSGGEIEVGYSSNGTLNITNGGSVTGITGALGGSTTVGTATVDGAGSTWNEGLLSLSSNGKLNITNGGSVSVVGQTYIASYLGSSGTINLGSGGTLTTGSLWASPSQVTGTGTINAYALVSDMALQFSSTASLKQTIPWNGVTLNLDMSMPGRNGVLGAGSLGTGSLTIPNGVTVTSSGGYLGYSSGAVGTAIVDGAHSTWSNGGGDLTVGYQGSATLKITNGGAVTNAEGVIGVNVGAAGAVTVDGAGSTWSNSSYLYVGDFGGATLTITNGGTVTSSGAYIGYNSSFGSANSGTVTVDGAGSKWINSSWDIIFGSDDGFAGKGTLNISNGGAVSVAGQTELGPTAGSVTTINFGRSGGTGGTLTTGSLCASPSQLTGAGTVSARGLVSDVALLFNSAASLKQTIQWNSLPNQNITINLDMSTPANNGALGAGWRGSGSLTIQNGTAVTSNCGYLGYASGSQGTACVDGAGSKWANGAYGTLDVGYYGNGTLRITNGGAVTDWDAYVGYNSSGGGTVAIDGAGSTWTNSDGLYVGFWEYGGNGALSISGGAAVTAPNVWVNSASLLAIDVGRASSLALGGSSVLTNNGTVRVLAGAGVPAGNAYSPISASTWSGSGTYQAVGGTWNDSDRQFTASAVQPGTSGMPVSIDLLSEQRILVSDSSTGWSVGVSFLAEPASTPLNFTATTLGGNTLASLDAQLLSGQSVLAAWSFLATSGYESGDPAYLSFDVGSASGLEVWQYNGSNWTQYDPTDLTDDGTYASFTVTSLGDYAVSAVPEPATIALLLAGAACLVGFAWRRRKCNS